MRDIPSDTLSGKRTTRKFISPDHATIQYVGANPGTDTVAVYADLNDNGQRDEGEPQRQVTVEWTGLQAPTFAQDVNVRPVKASV